jgi:hypothetical protein
MARFDVLVPDVPDAEHGFRLAQLGDAGYDHPVVTRAGDRAPGQLAMQSPRSRAEDPRDDSPELPASWDLIEERDGMIYRWPQEVFDSYSLYRIFRGRTARDAVVHVALGSTVRPNKWGRDRRYIIAFLSAGAPLVPLVEFLEADDYGNTREYVSVVRGKDGGRKMFGPGDVLPGAYAEHFRTQMYGERVDFRGIWNKVVLVVDEDDVATMLNHALLQARRRGDV